MPVSTDAGAELEERGDAVGDHPLDALAPPDGRGELGVEQAGPLVGVLMGESVDVGDHRDDRRPTNVVAASAAARRSAAGAMNGVWNAPPTASGRTLRAPSSLAMAVASAMASASPAITTCPAPLLLATHTSPAACSQAAATTSSSAPRTAAMVPGRPSAAACMAAPRSVTRRTPSSRRSGPDRRQRAVLAEAVAGGDGAAHAERSQGVVHDEAEHVGGELRVLRASELVGVGVEQEVGDVAAAGLRTPRRRSTRRGGRPRAGPSRAAGIPGRGR